VLAEELTARNIDADEERIALAWQCFVPAPRFLQGLAQHIVAKLADQPGFFGYRHELVGAELAAGRMVPAKQCLEARELVRGKARDRMVQERGLALLPRPFPD